MCMQFGRPLGGHILIDLTCCGPREVRVHRPLQVNHVVAHIRSCCDDAVGGCIVCGHEPCCSDRPDVCGQHHGVPRAFAPHTIKVVERPLSESPLAYFTTCSTSERVCYRPSNAFAKSALIAVPRMQGVTKYQRNLIIMPVPPMAF